MDTNGPGDRNHDRGLDTSGTGGAGRRPILGPLGDLMADLSSVRDGPMPPHREGEPPTHWWDEKNMYMSFNIEGIEGIDVDISVCYGKVYIRVAR